MKKKYWLGFWAAAVFLLFFMNSSLPLTDSVEGNYALTAKEMVLSGDWLSPQIYGRYWYDKPVFAYWMIALGFKIFGFSEFGARFFPSLFGLGGLWLTVQAGKRLYWEEVGFLSGILLLMTLEFFTISKSVLTDGMLFLFMDGALLCFFLGYSSREKNWYYGVYILSALATLTKGPIGFLMPGLIITLFLLYQKDWKCLKDAKLATGIPLFLLVALPWYIAMARVHPDFLGSFLGTQNVLRATVSEHPRDNVVWYYTAVNLLNAYAWVGFVPGMLWSLLRKNGKWNYPAPREAFLLLWIAAIFVFFQCMATKYITYTYPLLLPLCVLTADYIWKKGSRLDIRGMLAGNLLFYGALTYAASQVTKLAPGVFPNPQNLFYFMLLYTLCMAVLAFHKYKGKTSQEVFSTVVLLTIAFHCCSLDLLAKPLMEDVTGKTAAQFINALVPEDMPIYIRGGGYPTSGVFYTGREMVMLVPDEEADAFKPRKDSWSAKNIMPWTTYGQVRQQPGRALVLVDTKTRKLKTKLEEDWPGTWKRVKLPGQWTVMIKER